MEQYLIYLRKSRSDLEAEAHGEGETLSRHEHTLLELAKRQHLNVTDIYREVVSGDTIAARPMMQRVLSEVEQSVWSGVLVMEVERLARIGFEMAKKRRGRLCSVDKANVLECSRLWRETVERLSREYPEVEVSFMYVDNAAMQLILNPAQFDVMITGNLFGDILSDESAAIAGSLGMMPSASLGSTTRGLYEPIHGSAPDIAGRDIANPLGTILSGALLLRHSLGLEQEAAAIERAVSQVLDEGYRTGDIFAAGCTKVGCTQMGDLVAERV